MAKYKEYGLYNVYVDGDLTLEEIFGYEVEEEVRFLEKMYLGRDIEIKVKEV